MKIKSYLATGLLLCLFPAIATAGAHGKIKICRIAAPGADTSAVYLPADGTYTDVCHDGDNCRKFVIGVTAASTLKSGAGSCATLNAVLLQDDGQPLTAGRTLIANWNTGSLIAHITVAETFQ
ncbi:MAG: hypothetical protein JWR16_3377 [Nevskia sp.]|nr:hypothetical protein [Nevskia sp.]